MDYRDNSGQGRSFGVRSNPSVASGWISVRSSRFYSFLVVVFLFFLFVSLCFCCLHVLLPTSFPWLGAIRPYPLLIP
jgi:hypothetical protein